MFRFFVAVAIGCIVLVADVRAAIPRWDALPAVDVLHLQGPYAGTTVCPMCRHGYDAGLLVFLPSTTTPAAARVIASRLRETTDSIADSRFRPFLVLTGATPSPSLLEAVRSASNNWYVATLSDQALATASTDFQSKLATQAVGFVFAQRRMLWQFDPGTAIPNGQRDLDDHSRYAITFLRATYEVPVVSQDPDVPKGQLWTAANHLSPTADLKEPGGEGSWSACLPTSHRSTGMHTLIALVSDGGTRGKRTIWATTDGDGCVSLFGLSNDSIVRLQVFRSLQPAMDATIDTRALRPGDVATIQPLLRTRATVTRSERIVGPCEGCDGVFGNIPDTMASATEMAGRDEPGERMQLSGVVTDRAGVPQQGIVVYAYQTDATGNYPADPNLVGSAARHGRLRGWAQTDIAGQYQFRTIRPGAYSGGTEPQHIHMHIIEPGRCTYYLGDAMFSDDPRMTAATRKREEQANGGTGVVQPGGNRQDGWTAVRNIRLGLNVPYYTTCGVNSGDGKNPTASAGT